MLECVCACTAILHSWSAPQQDRGDRIRPDTTKNTWVTEGQVAIYIYIYVCVCVCVCFGFLSLSDSLHLSKCVLIHSGH